MLTLMWRIILIGRTTKLHNKRRNWSQLHKQSITIVGCAQFSAQENIFIQTIKSTDDYYDADDSLYDYYYYYRQFSTMPSTNIRLWNDCRNKCLF